MAVTSCRLGTRAEAEAQRVAEGLMSYGGESPIIPVFMCWHSTFFETFGFRLS